MKAQDEEMIALPSKTEDKPEVLSDVYSKDGNRRYYKSQIDPKPGDDGYQLYRSRIHIVSVAYPRTLFKDKTFTDYEDIVALIAAKIRKGHSKRFVRGVYIPSYSRKDGRKVPDRVILEVRTFNPTRTDSLRRSLSEFGQAVMVKVAKAAEADKILSDGVKIAKAYIPERNMDFGPFEFGTRPTKKSKGKRR